MSRPLRLPALLAALFLVPAPTASAQSAPIAVTIPAQFTISLPRPQPTACWRVLRPADGLLTAEVVGPGEWSVCIGDKSCPTECLGMLRKASTEALTQGREYFVRVHSLTPGTSATLKIYPTSTGPGAAPPPPPGGAAGIVGRWIYRSGGFSDVHVYNADGTVTVPKSPEAHATWTVEGNEVVSRWHNTWQNRVALPAPGAASVSGVAISPAGERQSITLTREGGAAASAASAAAPATPSVSGGRAIVGTWRYQSGSFTDVHVYNADGTITAPKSPEASAKWWVEGNEVVSLWHNKWQNRVRLPIGGATAQGVAISPAGARTDFTLTRMQ